MLVCENLSFKRNGREIFSGVQFNLGAGKALIVRGANGSGKTTLLRTLSGLISPATGVVKWGGVCISDSETFNSEICYLSHHDALKSQQTVGANLKFWHSVYAGRTNFMGTVKKLGVDQILDIPYHHLSAGWRRKVAITRLMLSGTKLWILDEPLSYLDEKSKLQVKKILSTHLKSKNICVIADHGNEYGFGKELSL